MYELTPAAGHRRRHRVCLRHQPGDPGVVLVGASFQPGDVKVRWDDSGEITLIALRVSRPCARQIREVLDKAIGRASVYLVLRERVADLTKSFTFE